MPSAADPRCRAEPYSTPRPRPTKAPNTAIDHVQPGGVERGAYL
jgi:hypothetical protein